MRRPGPTATMLVALTIVTTVAPGLAEAQARPPSTRRERTSPGSVDPVAVRAEYASALLQARRYREAAAEYQRLLQIQPANFEWRLNYARALEWGGRHREAEVELRRLQARAPRNATVEDLLRSTRASIEPTSREAAAWVAERPNYTPYRLALARALVRERRPGAAFRHFDVVLGREPSPALFAEAADAHAAGRDRAGAADLYRRAVERAPSDTALRRAYALALAANRQYREAILQYSTLPGIEANPRLLAERGEIHLRSGDETAAERDLQTSLALGPTPATHTLLGDMYRWRGQFRRARAAYDAAVALRPGDRRALARLAQLTREERPGFGYASLLDEQVGVAVGAGATADNTGFVYAAGEGRIGFPIGAGTVLGFGAEPRVVHDGSPGPGVAELPLSDRRVIGAAGSIGLAYTAHGEEIDARIAGRAGVAAHSRGEPMPILAGAAVATYRSAWSLSVEGTAGPAYENVMALALTDDPDLLPVTGPDVALLRSETLAAAVTVPFGPADLAARHESMWLSDGNRRTVFQGAVRLPLVGGVSLLYTGSAMSFAERSTLYWDPPEYVAHAVGLELGARSDEGLAFTARLMPGLGRTVEGLTPGDPGRFGDTEPGLARFVGQLEASADLSVRRGRWETALSAAFGTGRAGGYRIFDGDLRVRYIP